MIVTQLTKKLIAITRELREAAQRDEYHRLAPLLSTRQELMLLINECSDERDEESNNYLEILKIEDEKTLKAMRNQKKHLIDNHLSKMGKKREWAQGYSNVLQPHSTPSFKTSR